MESRFDHYWLTPWPQSKLRLALVLSMAVHVALGLVPVQLYQHQTKVRPPEVLQVRFFSAPTPEPPKEVKVVAVTEPEPKKPKPEPKKPKPEPKKPKPEPKKPEPEPKPKVEPEKIVVAKKDPAPKTPKVSATETLPSELGSWGRRVQLKVERIWVPPPGIRLGGGTMEAEIEFWVDRNGNLIGEPIVIRHATNRTLGESGVRAIRLAGTPRFPPLPATYNRAKQRVVYAFSLAR